MRYKAEEHEFLKEFVFGHSYKEIQAEFSRRFDREITIEQVRAYIKNNHLTTGMSGRFPKGNIPHNKGKKGSCAIGCDKTWFRKGNVPKNHREIGSERINRDGYIEIKVAEPSRWKLKHRLVWESTNGKIPKNCIVIFKDNNKLNADIENLMMITKAENAVMNKCGFSKYKSEFKETAVLISDLKIERKRSINRKAEQAKTD